MKTIAYVFRVQVGCRYWMIGDGMGYLYGRRGESRKSIERRFLDARMKTRHDIHFERIPGCLARDAASAIISGKVARGELGKPEPYVITWES